MIRVAGTLLLAAIALVLAGWLFYWSWCWGWWGQGSLVLRYLWQCQCPPQSEEARYPQRVDVLVPACMDTSVYLVSPSGRYLLLASPGNWQYPQLRGLYIYDVRSGELRPADRHFYQFEKPRFVTDDWLLEINSRDTEEKSISYSLINIHDSRRLLLRWIPMTPDHQFELGALRPLQSAEQVYVIPGPMIVEAQAAEVFGSGLAVALAANFAQHPEANVVLGRYRDHPTSVKEIRKILEENEIEYQVQAPFYYSPPDSGTLSRDHRFRYYGHIYLASNHQKIVEEYGGLIDGDFNGIGWAYQDSGIILNPKPTFVIGRHPGGLFVIKPNIWPVPQPILLLKVPKEYLSLELQQQEEARQAQENAAREQGVVTIRIGLGALVGMVILAVLWHHSGRRATGSNSESDVGR